MFLCRRDAILQTITKGVSYCIGETSEDDFKHIVTATEPDVIYANCLSALNLIDGLRAISVEDEVTEEFLSSGHWFVETVQADKSCAIMYNSSTKDVALVTFYDKEADFFIVDFMDLDNVPTGAILKHPLTSLSECIVYKDEILGRYDKVIILQGKEV